jgi:hypothetical protein
MATTLDPTARERVRATRLALTTDVWAVLLAAALGLAVAIGLLPSVPW